MRVLVNSSNHLRKQLSQFVLVFSDRETTSYFILSQQNYPGETWGEIIDAIEILLLKNLREY